MKKAEKIVKKAALAIAMVSLTLALPTAAMAKGELVRIEGRNRYETSRKIRDLSQGVETIVIVNGQKFPDAIMASVVSHKENAPILLVSEGATARELLTSSVTKAFVIGGSAAVETSLEDELKDKGIQTTRISGRDRYETSEAVNDHYNIKNVILASGENFPDALSAVNLVKTRNLGLKLIRNDEIPDPIYHYQYTVGGVIKNPRGEVLSGRNRYDTNKATIFDRDYNNPIIATGTEFADALSASYLVGKDSPILLAGNSIDESYNDFLSSAAGGYIIGGEKAVSESVKTSIENKMRNPNEIPHSQNPTTHTLSDQVLRNLNQKRYQRDIAPISLDDDLTALANMRAEEIAAKFAHERPDGTLITEENVSKENITMSYYPNPYEAVTRWFGDPASRANMLNSGMTKVGIGVYEKNGEYYWVALFN